MARRFQGKGDPMKARLFVLLFIAALLLALGTIAAACGGNGDGATSVDETPAGETTPSGDVTPSGGETPTDDAAGDHMGELTLEEYFQQVDVVFGQTGERFDVVGEFDEGVTPDSTDEEVLDAFREWFPELATVLGEGIDGMENIEPPAQAEEAHEEWLAAAALVEALTQDLLDEFEEVETADDLEDFVARFDEPEFVEASEGGPEACLGLQGIADANGIDVDLECEE